MVLVVASALVAGLVWRAGDGPLQAVTAPELRDAPEAYAAARSVASTDEEARPDASSEVRIGNFERPEEVPEYEILDERRNERDGARGAWLMVDTRSHGEEDYVLITRHLKARYAYLDAVSVEFIDLTETLRYNGAAVIFNTPAGVGYIGYVYGPPNARGYDVRAAD
ncbi:MAG: hypothetical protein M3533_02060 [Actinomycetota bacterium]|nr:hypothetical protein [Actinomycetota bacterium]